MLFFSDDCGGILAEDTGIIQSHDDDNNGRYDDNSICWWIMVAPPNTVIELEFTRMAIQDHAYCNHDYIQVTSYYYYYYYSVDILSKPLKR